MAKLSKRIRKSVRRIAASKIARDVLEDLISAALLAAAAKISNSRSAHKAVRKVEDVVEGKAGRAKRAPGRRRKARGKAKAK
jgi:hypothetical protein